MSGHVFHPGHQELHGITVLVETGGPVTYLGRFDSEDGAGVHLLDVGVHDAGGSVSKDEYVRKSMKFGIKVDRRHLVVPKGDVTRIVRLTELEG